MDRWCSGRSELIYGVMRRELDRMDDWIRGRVDVRMGMEGDGMCGERVGIRREGMG